MKQTVAIDFDGVLNNYRGWCGEEELGSPRDGAALFMKVLSAKYDIVVFTCRDVQRVREWLKKYNLLHMVQQVTTKKPLAVAYIDDRAINFDGDYLEVLEKLKDFKTYWEE